MDEIVELLVDFDAGEASAQELIDWAIKRIEGGYDTESVNELAWQVAPTRNEAKELLLKAVEELNITIPTFSERRILLAKKIANQMLEGNRDLNEGCTELSEISNELDSPESLSIFELLAHEQYDHDNIGITSENIKPAIKKAAEELVKSNITM